MDPVVAATRRWIADVVIGLNLCPFAGRVFEAERIRYFVSSTTDEDTLHEDLSSELQALAAAPIAATETTLLIHPNALADFFDYNDFLGRADRLLEELGLDGTIQIASFHPAYQFSGTSFDAVENYTNRSPYPMLHLLREESVTQIADDPAALDDIPRQNIATLNALGREKMLAILRGE